MNTCDILEKVIASKKNNGSLTTEYIASIKTKMDVFLINNRITEDEYSYISGLLIQ